MKENMKKAYRMYRRDNGYFYVEHNATGEQQSLETKDRTEAERLFNAKLEASINPEMNLQLAKVYISSADPNSKTRTWQEAMNELSSHGKDQTRERCQRAMSSKAFDLIRNKPIALTTKDHLNLVLKRGGSATNNYLRRLHNLSLNNGWIQWHIIAPKKWEKPSKKIKRAITADEHARIIASEQNLEKRHYYEMLWLIGAAQSDGAALTAENINHLGEPILQYQRKKTGEWCCLQVGDSLQNLLKRLPVSGPLFPKIAVMRDKDRSAEFRRRCKILKIENVSLHSYRYSWAERAYTAGYEERFAQAALGHKSRAVHHGYAYCTRIERDFGQPIERFDYISSPLKRLVLRNEYLLGQIPLVPPNGKQHQEIEEFLI